MVNVTITGIAPDGDFVWTQAYPTVTPVMIEAGETIAGLLLEATLYSMGRDDVSAVSKQYPSEYQDLIQDYLDQKLVRHRQFTLLCTG